MQCTPLTPTPLLLSENSVLQGVVVKINAIPSSSIYSEDILHLGCLYSPLGIVLLIGIFVNVRPQTLPVKASCIWFTFFTCIRLSKMPITHRPRVGCTKLNLCFIIERAPQRQEAIRLQTPGWNVCIRFIYGVNVKPYKCMRCIFEWRQPYVILWPWEYSSFFSFFSLFFYNSSVPQTVSPICC